MSWVIREFDSVADRATFDAVVGLRLRSWADQTPVPLTPDDVVDHHDEAARHWVAVLDGKIIGAARLTVHDVLDEVPEAVCLGGVFAQPPPAPIGFLSRLIVAADWRRRGVGRELDRARIRAADKAGCRSLLALVFDVSGEARVRHLLSHGLTVLGRGRKDTHPKFSVLAAPLVVGRVNQPAAPQADRP
jgi:GNAT superfamily N-acetyltransferase